MSDTIQTLSRQYPDSIRYQIKILGLNFFNQKFLDTIQTFGILLGQFDQMDRTINFFLPSKVFLPKDVPKPLKSYQLMNIAHKLVWQQNLDHLNHAKYSTIYLQINLNCVPNPQLVTLFMFLSNCIENACSVCPFPSGQAYILNHYLKIRVIQVTDHTHRIFKAAPEPRTVQPSSK